MNNEINNITKISDDMIDIRYWAYGSNVYFDTLSVCNYMYCKKVFKEVCLATLCPRYIMTIVKNVL